MTNEELDRLERLCDEARAIGQDVGSYTLASSRLLTKSRTALPELIAKLRIAIAALESIYEQGIEGAGMEYKSVLKACQALKEIRGEK